MKLQNQENSFLFLLKCRNSVWKQEREECKWCKYGAPMCIILKKMKQEQNKQNKSTLE